MTVGAPRTDASAEVVLELTARSESCVLLQHPGIPVTNVLITDMFWYELSYNETSATYLITAHVMAIFSMYELQISWSEQILTVEWQEEVRGCSHYPGACCLNRVPVVMRFCL